MEAMNDDKTERLKEAVSKFPASPGVYLMKNGKGEPVYIGKAASLKNRVRAYLGGREERYQIPFLMKRVESIEVMVTDTEKEALLLEDILIKRHRPRYNILLKDDKTYLSLRVDLNLDFPRVEVVRVKEKAKKKGVRYFGPYASAQALRETLALLQRLFPLRTCRESNFRNRMRPCLSYQIKRCKAPCSGFITRQEYGAMMDEVIFFLEGKRGRLLSRMKERMKGLAARLDFEEAARLRDCIASMEKTVERQKVFASAGNDRDLIALFREGTNVAVYILFIRRGKVEKGRSFLFSRQAVSDEDLLSSFIRRYYSGGRYVPSELVIPEALEDRDLLTEWLAELKGKKVAITVPKRGEKRRLLEMSGKNARQAFLAEGEEKRGHEALLREIKEAFGLIHFPKQMECFDISNIQGTNAVGSMVTFIDGKADKKYYRTFKIKSVIGSDDFAMMYEILMRRLKRGMEEDSLPDLIVVDGGRGQLGMAMKAVEDSGLAGEVDLLALAKEKDFKTGKGLERRDERVYMPGRKNPVKLKEKSGMLYLFQRIRDEAHRFAVTYHKKLRSKKGLASPLDAIPGIGPAKKKALLRHFGSLKKIRLASTEELLVVKGMTRELAEVLKASLRKGGSPD